MNCAAKAGIRPGSAEPPGPLSHSNVRSGVMKTRILAWSVAAGLFLSTAAWPQSKETPSLGELARKTREQREKMAKKPARVITNADFPESTPTPAAQETEAEGRPAEQASSGEAASRPSEPSSKGTVSRSREEWANVFRAARENLKSAQEMRDLVEDELNLLRVQRARALDTPTQRSLDEQIAAKQADLDSRRRAAAEAQKAIEELEKEFKDSGAPPDWMPKEE